MTPGDSFANDNTLRRRVGSLAPVSRFTFCRRSSRLPYRTVVCLPLSPRVGGSPENRRFSKEPPSISFSSSSSSFSFWCRISIGEMLKSKVENKCFFSETFLVIFLPTKYSSSIHDEALRYERNEASCRFSRALRQLYRKAETNCNRGIYRIALHRPVNRQLADLARKCKLAPVGRIGDRKKSKLSRQLSGCP